MTVLNLQVGASADDAQETVSDGTISLATSIQTIGNFGSAKQDGFRFTGVSGLSGAAIDDATLTFRADAVDFGAFVGDWFAHDAAAPGEFTTTTSNISDTGQRPRTAATCEGDGSDFGNWSGNTDHTFTGDGTNTIADIIQELANDYDPSTIVLLWIYTSGTGERQLRSYDKDTGTAPKLDITFTAAGGDPEGPLIGGKLLRGGILAGRLVGGR